MRASVQHSAPLPNRERGALTLTLTLNPYPKLNPDPLRAPGAGRMVQGSGVLEPSAPPPLPSRT